MVRFKHYNSSEEFKDAIKKAAGLKHVINDMLRAGATKEEFEHVGIKFAPIS